MGGGRVRLLTRWRTLRPFNRNPASVLRFISTKLPCSLTERTRRREVLPAFCSPIMVTSISVALHRISPDLSCRGGVGAGEMRPGSAPQLGGRGGCIDGANSPKDPQQPVIHAPE